MIETIVYVIQGIFFLVVLSYYYLLFMKPRKKQRASRFTSISIIIPARNEERFISSAINSVISAKFEGTKEIIVVDDASTDRTYRIASKSKAVVLRNREHKGKAFSINLAVSRSASELIAVVDADSTISENSLIDALQYMDKDTAGVTSIIKVKNRKTFLGIWLHIEQLYNSLMRSLFSKINANIVTPGPLSIYRKKDLQEVGGFSEQGYSEDVDVGVKLIRKGKKIAVSESSVAETYMPDSLKGFVKQRTRFSKGWIQILRKHMRPGNLAIDLYSLPLALFWYFQAIIMSISMITQIIGGYYIYFLDKGIIFNFTVFTYFLSWFSLVGTANWIISVFTGVIPLSFMTIVNIMATMMTYPLYIISILRYDKKIDIYHILAIFFMFPYWLCIMLIYLFNIPELFMKQKPNKWEKIN